MNIKTLLLIAIIVMALCQSCSDVLCPAYNSYPKHSRR